MAGTTCSQFIFIMILKHFLYIHTIMPFSQVGWGRQRLHISKYFNLMVFCSPFFAFSWKTWRSVNHFAAILVTSCCRFVPETSPPCFCHLVDFESSVFWSQWHRHNFFYIKGITRFNGISYNTNTSSIILFVNDIHSTRTLSGTGLYKTDRYIHCYCLCSVIG